MDKNIRFRQLLKEFSPSYKLTANDVQFIEDVVNGRYGESAQYDKPLSELLKQTNE